MTRARIAVMEALEHSDGHPSADEVYAAAVAAGCRVSRATAFNVLDDLTAAGLVMRANAGPGAVRYETAAAAHHHFLCRQCGQLVDVPVTGNAAPPDLPPEVEGRIEDTQIVYRGVCNPCLASG